jgi:hypothetical protein
MLQRLYGFSETNRLRCTRLPLLTASILRLRKIGLCRPRLAPSGLASQVTEVLRASCRLHKHPIVLQPLTFSNTAVKGR